MSAPQTVLQRLSKSVRQELQPQGLLATLSAGLINGIITVIIATAFASLIFASHLPGHLPAGVNLMLIASIVIVAVSALTSSLPGVFAGVQDSPVAIMAVVAAAIVHTMPPTATPTEVFFTIVAAMGLSSLLTGAIFFLIGHFKLGYLVRFIPYPVIGGFLGGTGLLLVLGALSTMVQGFNGLADVPQLFMGTTWTAWFPGTLFAVLLFAALNRFSHPLTLPGMVLGAAIVFYFLPQLWPAFPAPSPPSAPLGSVDLSGQAPAASLANPLMLWHMQHVHWPALWQQALSGVSVAVISVIALLLNASGLELAIQRDVDLNQELKAAGLSNLLAGLGGSTVGYPVLSQTALNYRMGAPRRTVSLIVAVMCGLVLLTGESVIQFLPKPVLGGLLLFLGLDFLVTWVYQTWFKLPRVDYGLLILILLVITLVGFLEGIGVGLALTVMLFVVNYSRVNIVRHTLSGATYQSNFQYTRLYQQLLKHKGQQIYILELQGFIFFGTAHKLLEQIKERVHQEHPKPRFVALDFRLVSGLDASAVFSFTRLKQLALAHDFVLVFTHLAPTIQRQLEKEVFQSDEPDEQHVWRVFPDLDHGVEWCEAQFLQSLEEAGFNIHTGQRGLRLRRETLPADAKFDKLRAFLGSDDEEPLAAHRPFDMLARQSTLRPIAVVAGDVLIRQGDTVHSLYFIESGQVTIELAQNDGQTLRLSTMGAGAVVGELSFYLGTPASASVIVDQPGQVYVVSQAELKELEATDPHLKAAIHEFMAHLLSERLSRANATLQAMLK